MKKVLLIVFFSLCTLSAFSKTVKLATTEWAPFVGKKLKNKGFTTDILKHAFKAAGYDIKVKIIPWKRVLSQVKKGKYDAGYPAYDSAERRKIYNYSETFASGPIVMFAPVVGVQSRPVVEISRLIQFDGPSLSR